MMYMFKIGSSIRTMAILLLPMVPVGVLCAQDVSYLRTLFGWVRAATATIIIPLFGLALLLFIWGIIKFLAGPGDEKNIEQGKRMMVWGVLALFILLSVWGIVALLQTMTDAGATDPPPPPQTLYF